MDQMVEYYALCLVAAGRSKDVTIEHRMHLLSVGYAYLEIGTSVGLSDKGKDKMRRRGK